MFRSAVNSRFLYASFFPFFPPSNSHDKFTSENVETIKLLPGEIGMDRVRMIFNTDNGHVSKELQSIISSTTAAVTGGFIFGGFMKAKSVPETFITENHATQFNSRVDAQRQMQYKFAMQFIKGGANLALKLGLFCFIFTSSSTCLYVFRGKHDLINFISSGGLTGFLYKTNMGIKGAIAGSVVGATLGAVYGCMTLALLYITGTKIEDIYEVHASLINMRRDAISRQAREYMDKDTKKFKKIYDENMEMKGKIENQTEEKSKA